ncbi:hypothetical protein NL387_27475, partial [Klebsiella pneumoniae]|nr:hypothetical protein [Klebsiella pneumoniae]
VYFKGQSGKYWHADGEAVTCDSDAAQGFLLELREPTRLAIRAAADRRYLAAAKNGNFRLADADLAIRAAADRRYLAAA